MEYPFLFPKDFTFPLSRSDIIAMEWHRVVSETPFARAFVWDIYVCKWECSYNVIKSFCLSPARNLFCCDTPTLGKAIISILVYETMQYLL